MMFLLTKKPTEERLRGYKKLVINGMRFKIKRINPLLDLHSDNIPQIFTDIHSTRMDNMKKDSMQEIKKVQTSMMKIIQAGVVFPELSPVGAKEGITPEDLFRDPSMGVKLYYEILNHSLNRFRGLTKVFFSIGIRLSRLMLYANGTVKNLQITSFPKTI